MKCTIPEGATGSMLLLLNRSMMASVSSSITLVRILSLWVYFIVSDLCQESYPVLPLGCLFFLVLDPMLNSAMPLLP